MCGFAGEFVFGSSSKADLTVAEAMATRLVHRGPDEKGSYISKDGRYAIGFRRLAIIDPQLSHQPMTSPEGNVVVAFNGEIYNYRELRRELSADGYQFRTKGDTEVLLALWQRFGQDMLKRINGMFAFVIYDEPNKRLFLARDRLGQKPLWYSITSDRIIFASEAKALLAHPLIEKVRQIDPESVGFYLTIGYVPAPKSIWKGVQKLLPGHYLTVSAGKTSPETVRYWTVPAGGDKLADVKTHDEIIQAVRSLLLSAVEKRMVADVPLGVLLSGGIDSSIIVALMCKSAGSAGGVKTFTAGFAEGDFDDRPIAARVAEFLKTDHTELLITPGDFDLPGLIDKLVYQYDEPFADSSALPTYLICNAARHHVTVALDGDGGDEVFCGYDRYRAMRLIENLCPLGWVGVKIAAGAARFIAPDDERSKLTRLIRFSAGLDNPPSKAYFIYRRLFSPEQLDFIMERDFAQSARINQPEQWFCDLYEQADFDDEPAYAQRHDLMTYLPDDLMVKADIASMANSLELRSPMLDYELIEFALTLPVEYRLRGRLLLRSKAILRDAFEDMLPEGHFNRPKRGFAAPIHRWLQSELAEMLRETLLEGPLVKSGWFARLPVERLIQQHFTSKADHRHRLWALLWLGRWMMKEGIA